MYHLLAGSLMISRLLPCNFDLSTFPSLQPKNSVGAAQYHIPAPALLSPRLCRAAATPHKSLHFLPASWSLAFGTPNISLLWLTLTVFNKYLLFQQLLCWSHAWVWSLLMRWAPSRSCCCRSLSLNGSDSTPAGPNVHSLTEHRFPKRSHSCCCHKTLLFSNVSAIWHCHR